MSSVLARGTVVQVHLDPTEGREIRKTRPAVVVSNDAACHFDAVVQVVPITSLPQCALRPYKSHCGSRSSSLARPARVVANQIRTVSRQRLGQVIGRLTPDEVADRNRALQIQLALDPSQAHDVSGEVERH